MAEPESTVINTNVEQVKGCSLQNTYPVFPNQVLKCHHSPELWWPELLGPGFQQKWLSQGCWAPSPSEIHMISSCMDWAGTFSHT